MQGINEFLFTISPPDTLALCSLDYRGFYVELENFYFYLTKVGPDFFNLDIFNFSDSESESEWSEYDWPSETEDWSSEGEDWDGSDERPVPAMPKPVPAEVKEIPKADPGDADTNSNK